MRITKGLTTCLGELHHLKAALGPSLTLKGEGDGSPLEAAPWHPLAVDEARATPEDDRLLDALGHLLEWKTRVGEGDRLEGVDA